MSSAQPLIVNERIRIARDELHFTFVRSSGPGGQNVNKVNSKAVLRWSVRDTPSLPDDVRSRLLARFANRINDSGELILSSQRYRDQARNARDCETKLRDLILAVVNVPPTRKQTRRPRWANESRLANKRATSERKRLRRISGDRDD